MKIVISPTLASENNPTTTCQPTRIPSTTSVPSLAPSYVPSRILTGKPSKVPSEKQSKRPSVALSSRPSYAPTATRAYSHTTVPTTVPSKSTIDTLFVPSDLPSGSPNSLPSFSLSATPTGSPTTTISAILPSFVPSDTSAQPTGPQSVAPSILPSLIPTATLTYSPINMPTPNFISTTRVPSTMPSALPSGVASSMSPLVPTQTSTYSPTIVPICDSSTGVPSVVPTGSPSIIPTAAPAYSHTTIPTSPSVVLSLSPSEVLFAVPTGPLSGEPSSPLSFVPTVAPSHSHTIIPTCTSSFVPSTDIPSIVPSGTPSGEPSTLQSFIPTATPTSLPSLSATATPSGNLRMGPTASPTRSLSFIPSLTTRVPFSFSSSVDTIAMSSLLRLDNFNVQRNLLLEASIRSSVECFSNWTVDNPALKLANAAILLDSRTVLPKMSTTVYLYLKANALLVRSSYQFTVRCGHLQSMVHVTTNSPPSKGLFTVFPLAGFELSTLFEYAATSWEDENLPLSYQFGFYDPTSSSKFVLREKSISNVTHTTLPSGLSSARYFINTTMDVFDSMSASVTRVVTVKVTPSDSTTLNTFIAAQLSNKTSSGFIVLIGNILNKSNCTGATNCEKYHRLPCSTMDYTCGECMSGYVGVPGPQNSPCAKINSTATTISAIRACLKDSDCSNFQVCNTSSSFCYVPSKPCPNSCSSQGTCRYVGVDTGLVVSDCKVTLSNCRAVCSCNTGFAGFSCALTTAQIIAKQNQRNKLLLSFNNLPAQNISSEVVISRASTLLSLTQKSDELGTAAASTALLAANNLLQNAVQAKVSYRDLTPVLQSTDSAASAAQNSNQTSQLFNAISAYGSITESQIIGVQNFANIFSNFRMSTAGLAKDGSSISVPQTTLETLQSTVRSSVYFAQNTSSNSVSLKVTVIESSAALLGNSKSFVSNPLIVQISNINGLNRTEKGHELLVSLKRIASLPKLPLYNFTTICRKPKFMSRTIFNYTCPLTGHVLSHNCSNKVGKVVSYCPVYKPSCQSLPFLQSSTQATCKMVNYTDSLTWCLCTIHSTPDRRRSLLSSSVAAGLQDSGALQLVAMSELVSSNVMNTFSAAPSLTNPSYIEKALIVIIMFATMWSAGFALLFLCTWRRHIKKRVNEKEERFLERKKRGAGVAQSPVAIQEYLSNYILEVFPAVFQKKSRFQQVFEEIRNHHRYISLFFSEESGPRADQARVLKVVQILSIQSLLMFLLALLYDLQSPADDGSCDLLATEATCLSRTSPMDSSQTYCSWTLAVDDDAHTVDGYICSYQDPAVTIQMVLVISVLVSLCTAIFLRPMEYLFDLLNAPTADSRTQRLERTKVERKVVNVAMASSTLITEETQGAIQTFVSSGSTRKKIAGVESRLLPVSASAAQELAWASASILTPVAKQILQRKQLATISFNTQMLASRKLSGEVDNICIRDSSDNGDEDRHANSHSRRHSSRHLVESIQDLRAPDVVSSVGVNALMKTNRFLTLSTEALLKELEDMVSIQRKLIRISELEEFDLQWGIDSTGEFRKDSYFSRTKGGVKENMVHPVDSSFYDEKEDIVHILDESGDSAMAKERNPHNDGEDLNGIVKRNVDKLLESDSDSSLYDSPNSQGSLSDDMSSLSSNSPQEVIVDMEDEDYCISAIHSEELSSNDEESSIHSSSSSSSHLFKLVGNGIV
eukprot:gene25956-34556_t